MNDALKMQISAFIDGELPENETELLLRRLSQDAALRQQAARYLEIGRLVRKDRDVPGVHELRGRIALALGEEAVEPVQETVASPLRYMKPAAGFAVAASVALLALFGLRQVNLPAGTAVDNSVAGLADSGPAITEPAIDQLLDDPVDDRLLEMHRRHSESSLKFGPNGRFSQLATFELTMELRDGEWVQIEPDEHGVSDNDAEETGDAADNSAGDNADSEARRVN